MSNFELNTQLHVIPTPAGAFYSAASPKICKTRDLLKNLMRHQKSTPINFENLKAHIPCESDDELLKILYQAQREKWIQGIEEPISIPTDSLEESLPSILSSLTVNGKILLADDYGLSICSVGFSDGAAEEFSALSADIGLLHERHHSIWENHLDLITSAWGVIDAAGNTQFGFWPLYVGEQRFVICIDGLPHLNHPDFVSLIWTLNTRYGQF